MPNQQMPESVNRFPLFFQFDDAIVGNGFICRVQSQGKVLLEKDSEGFWMYGVTPGALAGGGKERSEAFTEFKRAYLSVLFDIALEVNDADAFKGAAQTFFMESSQEEDWLAAVETVRQGNTRLEGVKIIQAGSLLPKITFEITETPAASANPQCEDNFAEAA